MTQGAQRVTWLPSTFCWTKMQAEAGQTLDRIITRKELERQANGGIFLWGVGNALGERFHRWAASADAPVIAFSPMRSPARTEDRTPDAIAVWLSGIDAQGRRVPLPTASLVTSRASTLTGAKQRHYALVCRAEEPLERRFCCTLPLSQYRNYASNAERVGGSQVTTVLEHTNERGRGPEYEISMVAVLSPPYAIRLADPVLLHADERALIDELSDGWTNVGHWRRVIQSLRTDWEHRAVRTALAPLSGAL